MPHETATAEKRSSLRTFAERLVAHEARGQKTGGSEAPPVLAICEQLRTPLTTLKGRTGYHALLARALTVAGKLDPWVCNLQVEAGGTLALRAAATTPATPQEVAAGSTVLVLTLLGLLVAFIGEQLTLRLIREVWPDLSPDDLEHRNGDKP